MPENGHFSRSQVLHSENGISRVFLILGSVEGREGRKFGSHEVGIQ